MNNYSTTAPFTSITDSSLGMTKLNDAFSDPLSFSKHNLVKQDALDRKNYMMYMNGLASKNDEIVQNCNMLLPPNKKSKIDQFLDNVPSCNNCKTRPVSSIMNKNSENQIFSNNTYYK